MDAVVTDFIPNGCTTVSHGPQVGAAVRGAPAAVCILDAHIVRTRKSRMMDERFYEHF